jgi:hypothetical protein
MSDLNALMLAAHEASDLDSLIDLYTQAAEAAPDVEATCFYLTHAFVFALEAGDARASELRAQLVAHGRETLD